MKRRIAVAVAMGVTLLAATGVVIAFAVPHGAVFIARDKPVTEVQVREKLQTDGYMDVQIARHGNYFEAVGSKGGKLAKILVDSRTGRLADDDDDDDD